MEARACDRREGRLPRARVGAGHRPGRLRQLRGGGFRGEAALEAAGAHLAPLERALRRRRHVAALRMHVRGPGRHLRVDRALAARARARQRHGGWPARSRGGHRVAPLLAVPRPLPHGKPLLQPQLGQREGLRGERRGVPEEEPPRAGAPGRLPRRAERAAARRVRPPERRIAGARRPAHAGGARRGPRRDARAALGSVRRRALDEVPLGQARRGDGRRARLHGGVFCQ